MMAISCFKSKMSRIQKISELLFEYKVLILNSFKCN
uniref:Uncharacterized protein n=1 Tax=Heterorhabditis bacteriophora TaxID=37862 RepID=A0A1I7W9A7_HETBA